MIASQPSPAMKGWHSADIVGGVACMPCAELDDQIVAGSGYCIACKEEGSNPKTGGPPCRGYISSGVSPYACKNCDHSYDRHM
jgi:hypothetical protein